MTSKFAVAGALEVGRPPLDHELPVRCAARRRREDSVVGTVRAQVALVRDQREVEAVDRELRAARREAGIRREELQAPVVRDVPARVRASVDRDREREGDRRRAVVAVVPDVGRSRDDRLARLRRGDVVHSAGRGEARRSKRNDSDRCCHDRQAEHAPTTTLHSLPFLGSPIRPPKGGSRSFYHHFAPK